MRYYKKDARKRGILAVFGRFSAIFAFLAVFFGFSSFTTLFRKASGGRHKLGNGEIHIPKKRTGIASALVAAGAAFLIGHGAGGGIYNDLRGALDTNNGKDTERYDKHSANSALAKRAGKCAANTVRDFAAAARASASAAYLGNAHVKHYGVNSLYNRGGSISAAIDIAYLPITAKALTARAEDAYVALAAEKNNAFVNYNNTVKFAAVTSAYTALKQ